MQHYGFAISVNDNNDEITGQASVTVVLLHPTATIELDLISRNSKGKGMTVTKITQNGLGVQFEHTANRIRIHTNDHAAGDTCTYQISYHGTPANGLIFSKNKFKQRTIFADNWPNRARNWLPCVDHPSDKAAVDFMVTAPFHYKVISNGVLVEESALEGTNKFTHWREEAALPTKVMVIGLADFAVNIAGNVDCIPVSSWVFPQDRNAGFFDYAQALEIMPYFIKMIGPYAYKKLANVEAITLFGGMENASAIFYNEQTITGIRGKAVGLIAHEIAHQWFGNSVTESGWPHVWLSEGFASEMANCYLESKYGEDTLRAILVADREDVIQFAKVRFTPVVDSSETNNYLTLLNDNSYKKGGWILHMLRRKLGDDLFWKGLRAYYLKYGGKNASTGNFREVMEEVATVNLQTFFDQWLYTAGHPQLQMNWKYDAGKKAVILHILQKQNNLFVFPLEFGFINNGSMKVAAEPYLIKDRISTIEIPVPVEPGDVIADPATNLLFEGTLEKAR